MALIKCKECGHMVSDKAASCPECGCPIEKGDVCKECGCRIEAEATVCPECGCPVDGAGKPAKSVGAKSKKPWLMVAVALLVVAVGYAGYRLVNGGSGKDAIVEITPEFIEKIKKYDQLAEYSEGFAAVCIKGKWGYMDSKGDEVVACQYEAAERFGDGMAAVKRDGKWGYINTKGEEVVAINIEAERMNVFSEGLAVIVKDYEHFSVINTKGEEVFGGKCDLAQWGEASDAYMEMVYSNGKVCVPTEENKFIVYDKNGIQESIVSDITRSELERQANPKPYTIFSKEDGKYDDYKYYFVGLKDSVGNEVIPAIYNEICNPTTEQKTSAENGVVLVTLIELGKNVTIGYADNWESDDDKRYYGYADLKGNTTFSTAQIKKCHDSYDRAASTLLQNELDEQRKAMTVGPDWLQGAWRLEAFDDYGRSLGYLYEVFNNGKSKSYAGGKFVLEREYSINGNVVQYKNGGHYNLYEPGWKLQSADGRAWEKVSSDPYYVPTSSDGSSSSSGSQSSSSAGSRSSNASSHRFTSGHDVIGWLSDKTFSDGRTTVNIRPEGVWINGRCATGAPVVERVEPWKALIRANTVPSGVLSIFVDPVNGKIMDGTGGVFYLK